ncbi:RimJ/RimL family protein N-acetyltransferase [Pedobacter cryoconitis]|uniref:GNAT family N-acetyltransferase n=1 Tax=Pedobacter cryoconitis TaxID=188932 RepID=UPI00161589DC|nr:GNAT family protein [Pedobacter cryoconitis]MBB6272473.1 RimJ/RimL family protein N-acetyltransferase [Pedobacter cryoconitis]
MNQMIITGKKITLNSLTAVHKAALIKAASDGQLWDLPFTVVPNEQTIDDYIATALNGYTDGTVLPFVIAIKESGLIVGSTRFWKIDPKNRSLEIGHTWIASSWQQTFVNTEAKYLMLKYAFEELKCIRVQFTTDEINEKSRSAILRLGAKEEGIIRYERIMPNGRKRNSVRFSIIEEEWPPIKKTLAEKYDFQNL